MPGLRAVTLRPHVVHGRSNSIARVVTLCILRRSLGTKVLRQQNGLLVVILRDWPTLWRGQFDAPESEKPPQGRPLHSLRWGALSGNAFQRFIVNHTTGQNCAQLPTPSSSYSLGVKVDGQKLSPKCVVYAGDKRLNNWRKWRQLWLCRWCLKIGQTGQFISGQPSAMTSAD